MLGMANSLNVATAAAILLYWLTVQLKKRTALLPRHAVPVRLARLPYLAKYFR
jgi:hypothetical protein